MSTQTPELHAARKEAFLEAFRVNGNISASAKAAGIQRDSHYAWLENDPKYVEAFEQAKGEAADSLVAEARRRAVEGERRPVLHLGKQVEIFNPETGKNEPLWETTRSDTLLIFLTKGALPDVYRDNVKVDQTVSGGMAISIDSDVPDWFRKKAGHPPAAVTGDDGTSD